MAKVTLDGQPAGGIAGAPMIMGSALQNASSSSANGFQTVIASRWVSTRSLDLRRSTSRRASPAVAWYTTSALSTTPTLGIVAGAQQPRHDGKGCFLGVLDVVVTVVQQLVQLRETLDGELGLEQRRTVRRQAQPRGALHLVGPQ
jgi:hypothetical protein